MWQGELNAVAGATGVVVREAVLRVNQAECRCCRGGGESGAFEGDSDIVPKGDALVWILKCVLEVRAQGK